MTSRPPRAASPVVCPFCGEEDLRPAEHEGAPVWHCRHCLRLFAVTFHGTADPAASTVPAPPSPIDRSTHR